MLWLAMGLKPHVVAVRWRVVVGYETLRTPPFMVGIHAAQRWFNGSWLIPQENGYSRAVPLRWMPAFTEKSEPAD